MLETVVYCRVGLIRDIMTNSQMRRRFCKGANATDKHKI